MSLALALLTVSCTSSARQSGESTSVTGSAETTSSGAGTGPGASSSATPETGPAADESRVLGMLPSAEDQTTEAITAPASVKAGEPFTVTVITTGNGCDRAGDVGVILGEHDATLMVYDYTRANRPDVVCTMIFKYLKHEVPLKLDRPGEAVIRVWGRSAGPGTTPPGKPVVIERKIQVKG